MNNAVHNLPRRFKSAEWIGDSDGFLRLIDQTKLPGSLEYLDCRTLEQVWQAIKVLAVRGAPAIGVAAAYGMVLAAQQTPDGEQLCERGRYLKSCRPTAVNLSWAVDQQLQLLDGTTGDVATRFLAKAHAIRDEDGAMCRAIGRHGAKLMPRSGGVLTHCNAGGLATSECGTALAAIFTAWENGKRFSVYVDETRPLLQGARLTCWELQQHGVDTTLICDNMAGLLMKQGKIQCVIVGADRIAANGDVANKVGTYSIAVLAKHHSVPLYVAAPSSTFDLSLQDGDTIPIEVRDPNEVVQSFGRMIAPVGISVYNPAFDVTPAGLIAGIVTENGLVQPVTPENVRTTVSFSQK